MILYQQYLNCFDPLTTHKNLDLADLEPLFQQFDLIHQRTELVFVRLARCRQQV
jgi:hypothetical protein